MRRAAAPRRTSWRRGAQELDSGGGDLLPDGLELRRGTSRRGSRIASALRSTPSSARPPPRSSAAPSIRPGISTSSTSTPPSRVSRGNRPRRGERVVAGSDLDPTAPAGATTCPRSEGRRARSAPRPRAARRSSRGARPACEPCRSSCPRPTSADRRTARSGSRAARRGSHGARGSVRRLLPHEAALDQLLWVRCGIGIARTPPLSWRDRVASRRFPPTLWWEAAD